MKLQRTNALNCCLLQPFLSVEIKYQKDCSSETPPSAGSQQRARRGGSGGRPVPRSPPAAPGAASVAVASLPPNSAFPSLLRSAAGRLFLRDARRGVRSPPGRDRREEGGIWAPSGAAGSRRTAPSSTGHSRSVPTAASQPAPAS